jgi:putative ATPase
MSDLWASHREVRREKAMPLAARLRPRTLDEFAGQRHFLGPGKLLRRMLDADRLTSLLFCGPPGTGKTTLAEVIANQTSRTFVRAHAAMTGVKDIRAILDAAVRRLEDDERRTILFLDEIHRFAKNQQDVLLNAVERGHITLIGATTENPYFILNSALVSRSTVFRFEPLDETDVEAILHRALSDERGFAGVAIDLREEAITHWTRTCDGDARRALNALEVAVLSQRQHLGEAAPIVIDRACAEESIQAKALVFERDGDAHYDLASAFIKSMRGSDPDAAVYWLARMLEAGEDPRFIARRISILASEDIGDADPQALCVAAAAWQIIERIGMPECELTLAQAVVYMACAPKSNATAQAIWDARRDVREQRTVPVPKSLRDGNSLVGRDRAPEDQYRSPHGRPPEEATQDYLGVDRTYYRPSDR